MEHLSTYPLTGIRTATTEPQLALLEHATDVLRRDERILAAWLTGSLAVGWADPFSDVDIACCVEDDVADALSGEGWKDILHAITPTVLATSFPPGTVGGYSLTPEWRHIDLVFHRRGTFDAGKLAGYRRLFDRTGELLPDAERPLDDVQGDPYFPAENVDWFFYMLGQLVTVVGRNEPVLGLIGAVTTRDTCLVPLFYAERGIRRTGGVKRLRRFLSEEQHALLGGLPPFAPTLDSVIECELAVASHFIPRGRALAALTGAEWPQELEEATVRHVEEAIGCVVPLGLEE